MPTLCVNLVYATGPLRMLQYCPVAGIEKVAMSTAIGFRRIHDDGCLSIAGHVIQTSDLCEGQIAGTQVLAEFGRGHCRSALSRCSTMRASFKESATTLTTLGDAVIGSPRSRMAPIMDAAMRRAPR